MSAWYAAAYMGEISVEAFLSRVGSVYSRPIYVAGRGKVWPRAQLDLDILRLNPAATAVADAAELL
jgi:hypothetical protein